MSEIVLVDNDYITVEYRPDHELIYHTIHQPVGGDILRDALNAGTAAMGKYKICKWLSDDRKNGPLSVEDAQWGATDWNPRTINVGWKYWANVVPEEVSAAGTLNPTMGDLYRLGLRLMVFTDVASAIEWLDGLDC